VGLRGSKRSFTEAQARVQEVGRRLVEQQSRTTPQHRVARLLNKPVGGKLLAGKHLPGGKRLSGYLAKHSSEKLARLFGESGPSGEELENAAIPYEVRRQLLASYAERKQAEKPSSYLAGAAVGGGAGAGSGALLAALLRSAKGRRLLQAGKGGAVGAVLGATLGAAAVHKDRYDIARAKFLHEKPSRVDAELVARVKRARQLKELGSAANAAARTLPEIIEERERTRRHAQSLAHQRDLAGRAEAERTRLRREDLLRSVKDTAGAEAAARGLFGKSLAELTDSQLAVVAARI
jgi:hypothetical protein